jgi:hypothetical protein
MDDKTQKYYSAHVHDASNLYNSAKTGGVSRYFKSAFTAGSTVLDMGAGSGRDMVILAGPPKSIVPEIPTPPKPYFDRLSTSPGWGLKIVKEIGFDVYGIDASAEMVSNAVSNYPQLKDRLICASIPSDELFFNMKFDGILCSAVLMHISDDLLFDTACCIRNNLKENGRLLISVPVARDDLDSEGRSPDGRLFIIRSFDYYTLLFERLGFKKAGYWEEGDGLGREGVKWGVGLYHLDSASGSRSLDKIESILNRDKKTATYKLALFRALTDIASGEYNNVKWYNDGTVGIPLRSIAEKWLFYYWPVFESQLFIPQINGEKEVCSMPVKFRKSLSALIDSYRPAGGVSSFYSRYINNELKDKDGAVEKLLREIEKTIVKGPVYYSGGSLDEGRVFSYNSGDRMVVIPTDIWRELSLMWHWIGDALILRWGELTSRMSGGNIPASRVIDLLLDKTDPVRDTNLSRTLFAGDTSLECVWSGKPIHKGFDIDHVIPYTLWHNNDLWNLLPSDPKVNNSKRDMLPSRNLLIHRKDVIKDYWDRINNSMTARFENEYRKFTGKDRGSEWHEVLFSAVAEAVEFTAIQRGVGRWEG